MAINTWINATADKGSASKPDQADHKHGPITRGAADGGDFTIAMDSAVVTKLATFDSLVAQCRQQIIARSILTS